MSENSEGLDYQSTPRPGAAGLSSGPAPSSGKGSVIGPTLVVKGQITAEEDLLIRGRVEGTIDHNQTLKVHQEGTVEAVVRAKEIHVEGSVEGDLFGTQRVTVLETGKVQGNVVAPRVAVMEGAHFKGMVDMDSDTAAIERRYQEQTKASGAKAEKAAPKADAVEEDDGKAKGAGKRRGNGKTAAAGDDAAHSSADPEQSAAGADTGPDKQDDANAS